jgi:hypothetical protein
MKPKTNFTNRIERTELENDELNGLLEEYKDKFSALRTNTK